MQADEHPGGSGDQARGSRPRADMELAESVAVVFEHLFGDGLSVLDPSVRIWAGDPAEELRRRIEDNQLIGSAKNQWEKLAEQLDGAPRTVVLLAAELVFLREQPLITALPGTRREHVAAVLALLDEPATIPSWMEECLDRPAGVGGFKPGQGYNGALWKHLIWCATFVREWDSLSQEDRDAAAADPWALQRVMLASGTDRSDIRNAIQFLARPDTFEPISSAGMKQQIQGALVARIGGARGDDPQSVDQDLADIRESLAAEVRDPFHFWSEGVIELWSPADATIDDAGRDEPRPRHYWIYSPGPQAVMWQEFSDEGVMAIGWDELNDLSTYPSREAIRRALVEENEAGGSMKNDVLCLWQFQHDIVEGDIIYAKRGRREIVGRGEVLSGPRYAPERGEYPHVREVRWTHVGVWPHPGDAVTKTLTDISPYHDYIAKLEALVTDDDDAEDAALAATEELVAPAPEYTREQFLSEVYLRESDYDRLSALLLRKKNVILAGPPGVGKTYAARRLAYSIMGQRDRARVQMVQFHQSYSYEDFMMGYRPTESGGFTLAEGPFYRFCEEARKDDPDRPYFFIIDEINRGNISKIFGELLMLIEADKRDQSLRLLYKNETFNVPKNVHIVGMMNTADRSLAVLDYALRRRFGFFSMAPGFDSTGFTAWQRRIDSPAFDAVVSVVVELNRAIAADPALGTGFAIGHSYLAGGSDDAADDSWLSSIVEDELVPLLDEYWFDEPETAATWAGRLRAAVA